MMKRSNLFLRRSTAYVLDIVMIFLILAPLGALVQRVLGIRPEGGPEVWLASLFNFSIPVWTVFILSDRSARGATLGKRLLRLRVVNETQPGSPLDLKRAALRTLIKLLPWEVIHISVFALGGDLTSFGMTQAVGLSIGNLLTMIYLGAALGTAGRRSVHDYAANTSVQLYENRVEMPSSSA